MVELWLRKMRNNENNVMTEKQRLLKISVTVVEYIAKIDGSQFYSIIRFLLIYKLSYLLSIECLFPTQSSSDFGNFFVSYLDYRACTLLIDLLRRTTIARQLGSHSTNQSGRGSKQPPPLITHTLPSSGRMQKWLCSWNVDKTGGYLSTKGGGEGFRKVIC